MTALTDAGSSNVRNAKHLERPVESRMMVQASTLPNWEKYFLSDSGVMSSFSATHTTEDSIRPSTVCSIPI